MQNSAETQPVMAYRMILVTQRLVKEDASWMETPHIARLVFVLWPSPPDPPPPPPSLAGVIPVVELSVAFDAVRVAKR